MSAPRHLVSPVVSAMRSDAHIHAAGVVDRAVRSVRKSLDMDVGFVSEFAGDERIIRHVDSASGRSPIKRGQHIPLSHGYCKKVVDGDLPELIPDTRLVPAAMAILETASLPIGSHVSVPIRFEDGALYGTLCCFGKHADPSLGERDLRMVRAVADLIAAQKEGMLATEGEDAGRAECIREAIASGEPRMVYQPVLRLSDHAPIGAEALARFSAPPVQGPDIWFAEAAEYGLQQDLELAAIRNAAKGFKSHWRADPSAHLAINVSAPTAWGDGLHDIIAELPADRLIIEITEHDQVADYARLAAALAPLRARGAKIAVDDAGSGYAGLAHIVQVRPDILKLDMSLVRGIDNDCARRAMVAAMLEFSGRTGCEVAAEGIETPAELATLTAMGIHMGQGYLLGRPGPVEALAQNHHA